MATAKMTMVFSYDVSDSKRRRRVAKLLEERMARVQMSVFEARMGRLEAERLAKAAAAHLERGDSLRVYAVSADGLRRSQTFGGAPIQGDEDYWLV